MAFLKLKFKERNCYKNKIRSGHRLQICYFFREKKKEKKETN